jgi:hypothetical protein
MLVIRIAIIRIAAAGVEESRRDIWWESYCALRAVSSLLYRHIFMRGFILPSADAGLFSAVSRQQSVSSQ